MTRVSIDFPDSILFSTQLTLHSIYINRGNHLGNSRMIDLCNETLHRFFNSKGVEGYVVNNQQLINSEYSVKLLSEGHYMDEVTIHFTANNFHKYGCDCLFHITHTQNSKSIALARLSYLTFDYAQGCLVEAKDGFADFFSKP